MSSNTINFIVGHSDRPPKVASEINMDGDASVDVYLGPDEIISCLEDLIADWDCLKPSKRQALSKIANEIATLLADD